MTNPQHLDVMTDTDQVIEQLDAAQVATPRAPSLDAQLQTIQAEASRLPDASYNFNLIEDFCNFIDTEYPALASITDDVWNAAAELTSNNNKLAQTVAAAAALASEFRAQREAALTSLAELRAKIETVDISDPAIAALAEQIEEYQVEMFELGFSDYVSEQLWATTPLEYEEITSMLEIFAELPAENSLWCVFREWLERGEQEIRNPLP